MRHAHNDCVDTFAGSCINDHFHCWNKNLASFETETFFWTPFFLQIIFESKNEKNIDFKKFTIEYFCNLLRCSNKTFNCTLNILNRKLFLCCIFESLSNPITFLITVYIHIFETNCLTIDILNTISLVLTIESYRNSSLYF